MRGKVPAFTVIHADSIPCRDPPTLRIAALLLRAHRYDAPVDMQPLRNPWVPQRKVRTRLDSMVANGHPCAWARTRDSATESKPPNGALGRAW